MKKDDFNDVQEWVSLKKYETPGEEYFDNFLEEFHDRQKMEHSGPSVVQNLVNQVSGVLQIFNQPRWAYASCAFVLGCGMALTFWNGGDSAEPISSVTGETLIENSSELVTISSEVMEEAMPHMQRLDFRSKPAPVKVNYQQVF